MNDMFLHTAAGLVLGAGIGLMDKRTRDLSQRAACLRASNSAANSFYDYSERLLKDPAMPDRLQSLLYDLTLAVTDEQAGRVAFDTIITSIGEDEPRPDNGLDAVLDELRKARGDLYDDFHNAMRSGLSSLMFAYGPDHSKVAIEFEATRSQSMMLSLLGRLDRVLTDWIANGARSGKSARSFAASAA